LLKQRCRRLPDKGLCRFVSFAIELSGDLLLPRDWSDSLVFLLLCRFVVALSHGHGGVGGAAFPTHAVAAVHGFGRAGRTLVDGRVAGQNLDGARLARVACRTFLTVRLAQV